MQMQMLQGILARTYGEREELIENMIERIREFYELPVISKTEEVNPRLFQFYRRGRHFVVIALCNEEGEILIQRDSNKHERLWHLIGGFIDANESIEDACNRLVKGSTGLEIDEMEPLVIVRNEFKCRNRFVSHYGVAFLVYARGLPQRSKMADMTYISQTPDQLDHANREILESAIERLRQRRAFTPDDEIEISRKQNWRQLLHKKLINPVFDSLSSKRLRDKVKSHCSNAETIIDVACGNDSLILELARNAKFCIANDVSWQTLQHLRQDPAPDNVLFTCHNALDLPFRGKFDVVICKNVLHHMHNLTEFAALTDALRYVGHKIILVDIENPSNSSLRAKLWHEYYVRFLGDRGRYFLKWDEFKRAVSLIYERAQIQFERVESIKGTYMFAVVELHESAATAQQAVPIPSPDILTLKPEAVTSLT